MVRAWLPNPVWAAALMAQYLGVCTTGVPEAGWLPAGHPSGIMSDHTRCRVALSVSFALTEIPERVKGTIIDNNTHMARKTRRLCDDSDVCGASTIATCPATSSSVIVHGRASLSAARAVVPTSSTFTSKAISCSLASAESMSWISIHSDGDMRFEAPMTCGKEHSRG